MLVAELAQVSGGCQQVKKPAYVEMDWSLPARILPHVDAGLFITAAQLLGDTIDCWSGKAWESKAKHDECHLRDGDLHLG